MIRMAASVSTALVSMLLASVLAIDTSSKGGDEPGGEPKDRAGEVVVVDPFASDEDEVADILRETYGLLARLRGQRLEERPKEMLDRAADAYKKAVAAFESENEAERAAARAQALTSRELARAVERLVDLRHAEDASADLPPPPGTKRSSRIVIQKRGQALVLPPELKHAQRPGSRQIEPGGVHIEVVPPRLQSAPRVNVETTTGDSEIIVVEPKTTDGVLTDIEIRVNEDKLRELSDELAEQAKKVAEQAGLSIDEVQRLYDQIIGGGKHQDPSEESSADLEAVYDKIQEAYEKYGKESGAKYYLDSARDVYNAARRDALAGRYERSIELAEVADTMIRVLPWVVIGGADDEKDESPERVRIQVQEKPRGVFKKKTERRIQVDIEPPKVEFQEEESEKAMPRKDQEEEPDHRDRPQARREAPDQPEKIGGVGLKLSLGEEQLVVLAVVDDSPADKDGRIKPGDIVLGLEVDGKRVLFAEKPAEEIVEMLRGAPGTTLSLVVKKPDAKEGQEKVLELKRAPLEIPREEAPPDREAEKPPAHVPPELP